MLRTTTALGIVAYLAFFASRTTVQAEDFVRNGSFEETKDSEPVAWSRAMKPAEGLKLWIAQNSDLKSYSAAIENTHRYEKPTANNWAQELNEFPKARIVRIRARIRTVDAESANICLQCWKWNNSLDQATPTMIAFSSAPAVRGSSDWHEVLSKSIEIPKETDKVILRAVLSGTGRAWFDDIKLEIDDDAERRRDVAERRDGPADLKINEELNALFKGLIIKQIELKQDCMILAYMPDWSHGNVDNIAVANNGGGVRTLLNWESDHLKELGDQRVVIAMYARRVTAKGKTSSVIVQPIANPWPERTSWKAKPDLIDARLAFDFEDHVGWKLFDITNLCKEHPKAILNGVAIHFETEREMIDWSGYAFASREAIGEWIDRRPRILLVK